MTRTSDAVQQVDAYSIDVGVFSGDWAKLYTWGYRVATFSVQ